MFWVREFICPVYYFDVRCFAMLVKRFDAGCQSVESRTQGSRPRPRTQKKNPRPRPRTAFPRTDTLEAKDRNARGQGQGPRTQAQVLFKIKSLHKNFSSDLHKKTFSKKFFKLHKILTIQKILLSLSRGQANFWGLEALRPRPRTWPSRPRSRTSKCVLEDVLEAKDVLEDSTSAGCFAYFKPQNFFCFCLVRSEKKKKKKKLKNAPT